jgi:amino acid adenylation domain-containing protein
MALENIARHFHASAGNHPERTAMVWEGGEVLYGELLGIVQSLRPALSGIPRVGILAQRGPLAFAAAQAILSEGAAYVPLRASSPPKHNLRILQLSGVTTIVADEDSAESLSALIGLHGGPLRIVAFGPSEALRTVVGTHPGAELVEARQESASLGTRLVEPIDGSAYVLFTSGSTGAPKGVVGTHAAVDSYLASFIAAYPLRADDRLAQNSDLAFDPSIHDMFVAWATGSALVLIPDRERSDPVEFARRTGISIWNSVAGLPALLESFGRIRDGALPKVRLSIFGGEKLTWNAVQAWKRVAPATRCVNMYGPTEATIAVTCFEIPADFPEGACHHGIVPIGRPFPGQRVEIRRLDGTECDSLEEGVLWVGGDQLTAGYLDPQMTAERFVERDGKIWYRTGDRVFASALGDLHFVGREDNQVKVSGFRIELGEIEAALLRVSGASFAVAEVARLRGDLDEIVCVLPTSCAHRKKEIRDALRSVLEPQKLPKIWKFQDDLPLNSNGKVDRIALKADWRPRTAWED